MPAALLAVTVLVPAGSRPCSGFSLPVFLVVDALVGLWSRRRAAERTPTG
ncbi:hypothetical protein [Streptomyces sp. NPDC058374]